MGSDHDELTFEYVIQTGRTPSVPSELLFDQMRTHDSPPVLYSLIFGLTREIYLR